MKSYRRLTVALLVLLPLSSVAVFGQKKGIVTVDIQVGSTLVRAAHLKNGQFDVYWEREPALRYQANLREIKRNVPNQEYPGVKVEDLERIDFMEMTKAERDYFESEGQSCSTDWCTWRKADIARRGKEPLRSVYVYINAISDAVGTENQKYDLNYFRIKSVTFHLE